VEPRRGCEMTYFEGMRRLRAVTLVDV
jgi:hypothetical protein